MTTRSLALVLVLGLTGACTPAPQSTESSNNGGARGDGSGGKSGGGAGGSGSGGTSASSGAGGTSSGSGGASASGGSAGSGSGGGGGNGAGDASGGSAGSPADAPAQPEPDMNMAAPDAGPSAAGCGSAKFCDGFEGQTAGGVPTGMFKIERAVTVDGAKGFKSNKSILVKGGGFIVFSDIAAMLPSNDLHGRAMIWMSMTPGAAHFDTVLASGQGGTYILGGMYKNFMSVYHPGDCSVDSKTPFPVGRWACIQWQFKGAKDGTHLHKMMLDGQVVDNGIQNGNQGFCVQGASKRDWKAPTFNTLKVGHVQYGGAGGVQLWIDDLAFGESEIPCPPLN